MTDKEFRHLKRAELIEIIYELQENEARLQKEVESLKMCLDQAEKRQTQENLIAQTVENLNSMLQAAQSAADRYIEEANSLKSPNDSAPKAPKEAIHLKLRLKAKERR